MKAYRIKTVDDLTFSDDYMFKAVLQDKEICTQLIERLLPIKVTNLDYPKLEKQIQPYYSIKGVRLDVYVRDSDKIIDLEMQSQPQARIGNRIRYYQSMIDIDALIKGTEYTELKQSYIVFICKTQPFKEDKIQYPILPRYTFRNVCSEDNNFILNDNALKVIYNASAYENEQDPTLKAFLKYVYTNEPGTDNFTNILNSLVQKKIQDETFREAYNFMNVRETDIRREGRMEGIEIGMKRGMQTGLKQGIQSAKLESAKSMLLKGKLAFSDIAEYTGLSLMQIEELQRQLCP